MLAFIRCFFFTRVPSVNKNLNIDISALNTISHDRRTWMSAELWPYPSHGSFFFISLPPLACVIRLAPPPPAPPPSPLPNIDSRACVSKRARHRCRPRHLYHLHPTPPPSRRLFRKPAVISAPPPLVVLKND